MKKNGNPYENSLKDKLNQKRLAAIQDQAREEYTDKMVSESLLTSYYIANASSYLIDFFSILTGSFAIFYLLHNQFGNLPPSLVYTIAIFLGLSSTILLQYGKRENLKIILPAWFKYKQVRKGAICVQLPLATLSILLTFYSCWVFPNFMNEVKDLEDVNKVAQDYKMELDSLDKQIAIASTGLTYQSGSKKGEVKTGASKLLKSLNESKQRLLLLQKEELEAIRVRNENKKISFEAENDNKGFALGWFSIFAEIFIFIFCIAFCSYYRYVYAEEHDCIEESPKVNTTSTNPFFHNGNNDSNLNKHDSFFFRTENHNKKIETPVITEEKTAYKLVVPHEKQDGSMVDMDKTKLAVRIREYNHRVSEKIKEIQLKGYSPTRMQELSNRFHKLDYWTRKQNDLINLYDENLQRI